LNKLVHTIENFVGKKAIFNRLPSQQGDVNSTYADISKARGEIGYNPQCDFETGIKKFVEWYNNNKAILIF